MSRALRDNGEILRDDPAICRDLVGHLPNYVVMLGPVLRENGQTRAELAAEQVGRE